jgi:hypothetical protein
LSILSFTLPYFLASKLAAYESRGSDCRMSHDIEDIIIVLDGQINFDEIAGAPGTVIAYLKAEFQKLLSDASFVESIHGHLPPDPSNVARARRIIDFFDAFSKQNST